MDNVYNNINDYNPNRDRKFLDDMIADFMTNKKISSHKTLKLFIRCKKLNISLGIYHEILFFCSKIS